jgi:DNA-binding NtrC family response regulator
VAADETTELEPFLASSDGHRFDFGQAFVLVLGAQGARLFKLERGGAVLFGRGAECDFVIDDGRVSRRHARLAFLGKRLVVRDLGSRNGTRVGDRLLREEELELPDGAVVRIGPARVVVGLGMAAPERERESPPGQSSQPALELMEGFVVSSSQMSSLLERALRVARTKSAVLITGETGSGKEVLAEQIHRWSPAASGPFLRMNCAAVPRELVESELFGHERGAFTGAVQRKLGFLEAASKGTLLLDEVGEMSLEAQAKLLRALEMRTITRIGGTDAIELDTRFIYATHRDLSADVKSGRFREDLLFRINTFQLEVPPLRARPSETLTLASLFVDRFARLHGTPPRQLSLATVDTLLTYAWPGNVRELRNAIEHAVVLARGDAIEVGDLPESLARTAPSHGVDGASGLRGEIADLERERVEQALELEAGNQTRAAARLGISRRGLIRKLEKYGFKPRSG